MRRTIGWALRRLFLLRGALTHDLKAPVPGAPALPPEGDPQAAWARLYTAIAAFQAHEGPLQEHLMFGAMDKPTYERMHAMHIADHLSGVTVPRAG